MADDELELGDSLGGQEDDGDVAQDDRIKVIGARTCEDWGAVYRFVEDMTNDWDELYRNDIVH